MKHKPKTRKYYIIAVLLILIIALAGTLYLMRNGDPTLLATEKPKAKQQVRESVTRAPSKAVEPNALIGRWMRTDGNYTIEIKSIGDEGQMEAAYYNPRPINISLAEAYREVPLRIYIEFKDVGYEGSYYNLNYDANGDILRGSYFQASYGQTYQVMFVRQEN